MGAGYGNAVRLDALTMTDNDTVQIVCEECGRSGDVKPKVVDLGTHRVAIEETAGDTLIQWQEWKGHWFCHTCLADYANGGEEYYPESVSGNSVDTGTDQ